MRIVIEQDAVWGCYDAWLYDDSGRELVAASISEDGYIGRLFAYKRNKGYGTMLMTAICAWADEKGLDLYVWPTPESDDLFDRLVAFYRRFGFDGNQDRMLFMRIARETDG